MTKTTIQNIINHPETELQILLTSYDALNIPNPLDPDFQEPIRYGDYTRLEEGENTLRILSEAVIGCEYWIEIFDQESGKTKKKPVRRPLNEATSLDTVDWSYFNAFFVWNYKAQKIQILNTTKRGIIKGLKSISKNPKWGDITEYDICISKTQTDPSDNKSVEYSVTPEPKAALAPEIAEKWEKSKFNRNALYMLFEGLDPFEYARKAKEQELNNSQVPAESQS